MSRPSQVARELGLSLSARRYAPSLFLCFLPLCSWFVAGYTYVMQDHDSLGHCTTKQEKMKASSRSGMLWMLGACYHLGHDNKEKWVLIKAWGEG